MGDAMAALPRTSTRKIKDPDLVLWVAEEGGDVREILVDAVLPDRKVSFDRAPDGRLRPKDLQEATDLPGRQETLKKLRALLARLVDTPPVVLEAAGALAVRASSRQVRQFVDHPLVKSVRPNRRLHRI